MVDDFVFPVDQRRDLLTIPTKPALVAFRSRLQMETQARGVGLALDRVQPTSLAAKAHAAGLAHADPIGRLVGAAGQLLRHEAVDMLSEPAGAQTLGRLVQAVFGETILRAQPSEGLLASGLVGTRSGTSCLPGRVSLHPSETLHRLGEQGIVELARAFKMSMQMGRVLRVHLQGQGEDK